MFITEAFADDATQAATAGMAGGGSQSLLMLVLIFAIFYFLLIQPQSKRIKQHRAMIKGMQRGDEVVTSGGIIGKITKVDSDDVISVEIAEGITVQVARSMVAEIVNKKDVPANDAQPVSKKKGKKADEAVEAKSVANDN